MMTKIEFAAKVAESWLTSTDPTDGHMAADTMARALLDAVAELAQLQSELTSARDNFCIIAKQLEKVAGERDAAVAEIERMRQQNVNEVGALWAHQAEVEVERDEATVEVERLKTRQQELLATIVRVTNETPFPDEVIGWQAQRAAMTAEIGTLRASRNTLSARYSAEADETHRLHVRLGEVVAERDRAISELAAALNRSVEQAGEIGRTRAVFDAVKAWHSADCIGADICLQTVDQHDPFCPTYTSQCALYDAIDTALAGQVR